MIGGAGARARFGGVVLFAIAVAALPSRARADLTIAAPSCESLDVDEVRRLLSVEIEDVAAEWSAVSTPVVLLGCADGRVRIEITDPITDKSVARTVVLPDVDRERVIAIAIAQLFLTSWLELLIDADAPDTAASRAAERRAREALALADESADAGAVAGAGAGADADAGAVAGADAGAVAVAGAGADADAGSAAAAHADAGAAPDEPAAPSTRVVPELSVEGGARFRLEGEQLPFAGAALRGAIAIDGALIVALRASFEWSRATRTRGTIDGYGATIGLGAGWRTPSTGPFFLDVVAWISPGWILLEGRPSSRDVEGGSTQAIVAEASLELAPSLRAGPVIVALALGAGGIAFAPEGVVSEEAPVVIGGALLSAALRISIVP